MNRFDETLKSLFKPGTFIGKIAFGLLFFLIAVALTVLGFWRSLFVAAVTMIGVFIGSAETIGKATAKLIDRIYPNRNTKIVYTPEDLEKVRKAAEQKRESLSRMTEDAETKAKKGTDS